MTVPAKSDPEVASRSIAAHLADFFQYGRGNGPGWECERLSDLSYVVTIPATRTTGETDQYFIRLDAHYYPTWPPIVKFVSPGEDQEWVLARPGSRYWPVQGNSPGFPFGLHDTYTYEDQSVTQLICFSHSFDFYISNHTADDKERWSPSRHTVSATLSRIAQVLTAPNYLGPSGADNS